MRVILLLFTFLLSQALFAQPYNQSDDQGRKTGKWRKVYANGKVRYIGQFKEDIPVGTFKYYDTNGFLVTEIKHSGDGHSASCTMYFPKHQQIRATGFYYDQKKDSTWTYYSERTKKVKLIENYKRGDKHGVWMVYYDNGLLFSEAHYQLGKEHGIWKEYFEDGKIRMETSYKNGLLDGPYLLYNIQGKVIKKGDFVQGKRHGKWIYKDSNGNLEKIEFNRMGYVYKEEIYKNGMLVDTKIRGTSIKE
jgi:antitoxin component YwqK of YwqJK toxin-antitoxin module